MDFGHDADPLSDYLIEVNLLLGKALKLADGGEDPDFEARLERAMLYRVGGTGAGLAAKAMLQTLSKWCTSLGCIGPRALTAEEARERVLEAIRARIDHFGTQDDRPLKSRLEGLAHSILAVLDGEADGIPAFRIVCAPTGTDAAYHRERGEKWFSLGEDIGPLRPFLFKRPSVG